MRREKGYKWSSKQISGFCVTFEKTVRIETRFCVEFFDRIYVKHVKSNASVLCDLSTTYFVFCVPIAAFLHSTSTKIVQSICNALFNFFPVKNALNYLLDDTSRHQYADDVHCRLCKKKEKRQSSE